jgi:hypothetical protein
MYVSTTSCHSSGASSRSSVVSQLLTLRVEKPWAWALIRQKLTICVDFETVALAQAQPHREGGVGDGEPGQTSRDDRRDRDDKDA